MDFPDAPYLYRQDVPEAGSGRPISQGDVFVGVPLAGAATPDSRHEGVWKGRAKTGVGLLITHPCASRSRRTFQLNDVVSLAPVLKRPRGWGAPWEGYFQYFPLPGLRGDADYAADLNSACPVPTAALAGKRIACLSEAGLTALFHRLAMNQLRYPEIPTHYKVEAHKLMVETELWERWVGARNTEDGFQEWLSLPFGGQPIEDENGIIRPDSGEPTGDLRRDVLGAYREALIGELEIELGS